MSVEPFRPPSGPDVQRQRKATDTTPVEATPRLQTGTTLAGAGPLAPASVTCLAVGCTAPAKPGNWRQLCAAHLEIALDLGRSWVARC